jgi:hypothetical protein
MYVKKSNLSMCECYASVRKEQTDFTLIIFSKWNTIENWHCHLRMRSLVDATEHPLPDESERSRGTIRIPLYRKLQNFKTIDPILPANIHTYHT